MKWLIFLTYSYIIIGSGGTVMEKNELKTVVEELIEVPFCADELKEAGKAWLDALGTEKELDAAKTLITEAEEDIMPIEGLVSFADSDAAVQAFGDERAAHFRAHAHELLDAGAKYCDCQACTKALTIIEAKDILLG